MTAARAYVRLPLHQRLVLAVRLDQISEVRFCGDHCWVTLRPLGVGFRVPLDPESLAKRMRLAERLAAARGHHANYPFLASLTLKAAPD